VRILIVGPDKLGSEYGGGQVYVKNLVAGLLAHQHDVSYMSITFADISLPQRLWSSCATIKELQLIMPAIWCAGRNPTGKSHITDEIASVFKEFSPDIVHAHGWKEYSCIVARQSGIPCVVTAHHGGLVCPAGALLNANDEICRIPANARDCYKCCIKAVPGWRFWCFLLNRIPNKIAMPIGRYISGIPFIPFVTPLGIIPCSIKDKIKSVKEIGANADRLIAPSPAIGNALVRNGVPEQKVVVVPHGIPPLARRPLPDGLGKRPLKLLYLGRINHVKGLHIMLDACAQLPRNAYELHIVGEAVTRQEKRYCRKLKKKFADVSVIWHGGKPHDEIPELIADRDLMIHPAIFLEVFGLTIAESLALGRPVIASRCGGAEIQVRDGENGLLVPPNDSGALSDALLRLIENPGLVRKMADKIGAVHTLDAHIYDLEKIYKTCRAEKEHCLE
jgi:glycosyltransferase involved in cell wall biosynthesis